MKVYLEVWTTDADCMMVSCQELVSCGPMNGSEYYDSSEQVVVPPDHKVFVRIEQD